MHEAPRTSGPPLTAFFAACGQERQGSEGFRELSGGLLTLRAARRVLSKEPASAHEISKCRGRVRRIANPQIRTALSTILDSLLTPSKSIIVYGRVLAMHGQYVLAEDTFATAAECALHFGQRDLLANAEERRGFCLRHLGEFERARAAYMNCAVLAAMGDLRPLELLARAGMADIAIARGNFAAAQQLLDEVIADGAEYADCRDVLGRAFLSRGIVAHERGRPAEALGFYIDSLLRIDRDRALWYRVRIDIGRALRAINSVDAARLAFNSVRLDSPEPTMRTIARINLLALAAEISDRRLFDAMVGELERDSLTPRLKAFYDFERGSGLVRFGLREAGRRMMAEALVGARRRGIHDVEHLAETELDRPAAEQPEEETAASREAAVNRALGVLAS